MADNFSSPRPSERPAGLASRPAPREEKKTGFMESIRSFFSRDDDDTDTYVKARDKFYDDPYMAAMEDAAKRATERREQGITQSRKPSAPPAEVYTPEVVEPERATEEVVADVPTGKGLMSVPRPRARPETTETSAPTKEELIASVFKAEGGYSTDVKDSGNYYNGKFVGTNHGVSAPMLAQVLGREPTVKDMKSLTKEKAKEIAGQYFYDRFEIDALPSDLQEIVFHAVYMGETRGVRALQNLLGLTPDGVLGPKTKAAMQNATFTKAEFKDEFLRELREGTKGYSKPAASWKDHGKGWTNRYNALVR